MHESMFWTNFAGLLTAILFAFGAGHMFEGIAFCKRHPEARGASCACPRSPTLARARRP